MTISKARCCCRPVSGAPSTIFLSGRRPWNQRCAARPDVGRIEKHGRERGHAVMPFASRFAFTLADRDDAFSMRDIMKKQAPSQS